MTEFERGPIEGVRVSELARRVDGRGWLVETFRLDELPAGLKPVMGYVSMTEPGVARGPHEHERQTDLFAFIGPANFLVALWDARRDSPSRGNRLVLYGGAERPVAVIVPPGVVHAYRNVSRTATGMVLNYPDALYAGWGRAEEVDEVRHEEERDVYYEDFLRL